MSNTPPPPPPSAPGYGPPAPQPSSGPPASGSGYGSSAGSGSTSGDKYNVLSIVSLITGFCISLAAVITGHIALSQIKRTGEKGRGLAIAGLILGYLGILGGIIAIVAVVVLFSVVRPNELANDPFGSGSGSGSQSTNIPAPTSTSGSDASGAQTTAESCQILLSSVSDSASQLQENLGALQSDPAAAVQALQNLSADFDSGLSQISDPDVYAAGDQANTSLKTMIADIQDLQANPSGGTSAILEDAQSVQDDFSAIDTVCP